MLLYVTSLPRHPSQSITNDLRGVDNGHAPHPTRRATYSADWLAEGAENRVDGHEYPSLSIHRKHSGGPAAVLDYVQCLLIGAECGYSAHFAHAAEGQARGQKVGG